MSSASLTSVMSTPLANHSEMSYGKRLFDYPSGVFYLFACLLVVTQNTGPKSRSVAIASRAIEFGVWLRSRVSK